MKLVLDRTKNDVLVKKISIMAGFDDTYHDTSTIRGQKEKEKEKKKKKKKILQHLLLTNQIHKFQFLIKKS